jgi:hypothetical protein
MKASMDSLKIEFFDSLEGKVTDSVTLLGAHVSPQLTCQQTLDVASTASRSYRLVATLAVLLLLFL